MPIYARMQQLPGPSPSVKVYCRKEYKLRDDLSDGSNPCKQTGQETGMDTIVIDYHDY